jgi:DNA mismatch endonuclease (patch repair protein)
VASLRRKLKPARNKPADTCTLCKGPPFASFQDQRAARLPFAPGGALRHGLHARGLRYRLHRKDLPGRPDLVFPRYRAAILVHGCLWHGHDCPLFKWPATRREFWQAKIEGNRARDARDLAGLAAAGWRVLVVWECALKGPARLMLCWLKSYLGWHPTHRTGLYRVPMIRFQNPLDALGEFDDAYLDLPPTYARRG